MCITNMGFYNTNEHIRRPKYKKKILKVLKILNQIYKIIEI
jgi:hypothetical protein